MKQKKIKTKNIELKREREREREREKKTRKTRKIFLIIQKRQKNFFAGILVGCFQIQYLRQINRL